VRTWNVTLALLGRRRRSLLFEFLGLGHRLGILFAFSNQIIRITTAVTKEIVIFVVGHDDDRLMRKEGGWMEYCVNQRDNGLCRSCPGLAYCSLA
jgi:hypothetical protein